MFVDNYVDQFLLYEDELTCDKKRVLLNFYLSFGGIGSVSFSEFTNMTFRADPKMKNHLIFLSNNYFNEQMGKVLKHGTFKKITIIVDEENPSDEFDRDVFLSIVNTLIGPEEEIEFIFLDIDKIFKDMCVAMGATSLINPVSIVTH